MDESSDAVLKVEGLTREFVSQRSWLRRLGGEPGRVLRAVNDVSFSVPRGTTFALIGESGSGKSTIARCVTGVLAPTSGYVTVMSRNMSASMSRADALALRRNVQMVFQDPYASLNPRWRAFDSIAEPLRTHGLARGRKALEARVFEMLRLVGLAPEDARRFPHQFSGGQRQRISIARALAAEPAFIVADEPTSALDVSVQSQILNLMRDLQTRLGLTYLFISHNLAVVSNMANRIGVLYLGRIVETGPAAHLLSRPRHPYTRMLVEAVPDIAAIGRQRALPKGDAPDPADQPAGCPFHPRCPLAVERCRVERPVLRPVDGVQSACHRAEELRAPGQAANAAQPVLRAAHS